MKKQIHVGLDSQCYTYRIDAMAKLDKPVDDLAKQRIALFRIFLYRDGGLFISPTVRSEYQRIRSQTRAVFHEEWTTLFPETRPINSSRMDARIIELQAHHPDADDCRILAEAEDAGLSVLLSFDSKFISRLSPHTPVSIMRPLDYWPSLNIPRGSTPATTSRFDNPMADQSWWKWI
ncbi:MAG: hypothetical protein Nkreftii_001084 [Candidatus Nitrospira kreftii]|uniref:PIN domain-containing protein n=1 Tax=Candidatus Nitrospira kreftii TaxID=2652173 RepID=A0A7S8FCI3_9BACT|nr:MAG: hypothetical protein Nkreftii_001084 [Candidatus Nitrospira kreftii]